MINCWLVRINSSLSVEKEPGARSGLLGRNCSVSTGVGEEVEADGPESAVPGRAVPDRATPQPCKLTLLFLSSFLTSLWPVLLSDLTCQEDLWARDNHKPLARSFAHRKQHLGPRDYPWDSVFSQCALSGQARPQHVHRVEPGVGKIAHLVKCCQASMEIGFHLQNSRVKSWL